METKSCPEPDQGGEIENGDNLVPINPSDSLRILARIIAKKHLTKERANVCASNGGLKGSPQQSKNDNSPNIVNNK